MILLFTTTRRALYKRDILNICCFPEDSFIRFGYKGQYIQESLKPNQGAAMANKDALIIFCEILRGTNFDTNKEDYSLRYQPVRYAKIVATNEDALGAFRLTLQLKDFFNYDSQPDSSIRSFQDFVNGSNERPYTMGKEMAEHKRPEHFAVETLGNYNYPRDGSWEALVNHMGSLSDLTDCVFVTCKRAVGQSPVLPEPKWTKEACRPDYSIAGGASRSLTLQLLFGSTAENRAPELVVRPDVATVCGPFSRQSNDGWETEFMIAFKGSFHAEFSTFSFRVPPNTPTNPISPEWNGLIRIQPTRGKLILAVALLMAGTALQAFSRELTDEFAVKPSDELVDFIKLIGTFVLGLGAYFGLSKLPFKGGDE